MRIGDPNVQAMQAIQTAMQASANNLANVNTEGFKAQTVSLETGPGGYGVRVGDVVTTTAPGPAIPAPDSGSTGESPGPVRDFVQGSNTDITREMITQTVSQEAYAANATVVRTTDAMHGVLLDMLA
jgi:flagellar hook protein FlgE